jgi:hypothetical protein
MLYAEILILALLTAINGLLAMSEMAIASSRMSKLKALAEQNVKGANRAMALASDPGRFLSTVQPAPYRVQPWACGYRAGWKALAFPIALPNLWALARSSERSPIFP